MRIDSAGFAEINQNPNRRPRYVVKIEFEGTPSVDYYVTSHKDCELPDDIDPADISYNTLENISGVSQRLNPIQAISTIGAISFDVVDKNQSITDKINLEYGTGVVGPTHKGLRGKTVNVYIGDVGLLWDDYILIQTQIIQNVSLDKGIYTFYCGDIQRSMRDDIFDPHITTLYANINATQIAIPVADCADFEMLDHSASYSDHPSETVGYIEIKDEVIAYRGTLDTAITLGPASFTFSGNTITCAALDLSVFASGMIVNITGTTSNNTAYTINPGVTPTANVITVLETTVNETAAAAGIYADIQFYNCTRGALNTKAVELEMSEPLPSIDRREKVTELVYLELPAPKLLYAVLTGGLYGELGVLPSNWHLGISTAFVATTEFVNIGKDLWDPSDDTLGFPTRFIGPKKVSGKKFIEEELLLLAGLFIPVLSDGQMGLRRMTNILNNASPLAVLNEKNVISIGPLNHNMEDVHNKFDINWNWDRKEKRFTRSTQFVDGDSITRHGLASTTTMNFQGLHGSSATASTLINRADGVRDRYAGPPQEITVKCMFALNVLEVGDIVKLKLDNLQDFVTGGSIDRSFEIQQVRTNWRDGTVTLNLFGSSQPATSVAEITVDAVLDNAFYTAAGTNLSTVTTGSGTTKWTITGANNLTGDADLTSAASIFYYDGDVEIASGATLSYTGNIQLRISGDLTVNGTLTGKGGGMPAPAVTGHPLVQVGYILSSDPYYAPGTAGAIGTTQSHGAVGVQPDSFWGYVYSYESPVAVPYTNWNSLPTFALVNEATSILGMPTDLRGTSGGQGGYGAKTTSTSTWWKYIADGVGGQGGAGGAGLAIVTKNMFAGGSGVIDLSGADGAITTNSNTQTIGTVVKVAHAANGGGGAPGGFLIVIDGDGSADTSIVNQYYGVSPISYTIPVAPFELVKGVSGTWSSGHIGVNNRLSALDYSNNVRGSFTRVQRLTLSQTAEIDTPSETSKASVISLQEVGPASSTLNQTAIEVSVSAPAGSGPYVDNYKGSHIYARNSTGDSWFDIGVVGPLGELSFAVAADGTTWEVKAHAVSAAGVMSPDYISDTITVTATLSTVIGSGNRIVSSPEPEFFGGVEMADYGIKAFNNVGDIKLWLDASTGIITATDVDLSGTITATSGNIGGWSVTSTKVASPDGRVILDSANDRIQVQDGTGTNYTRMNADGITGVDSVLGTTFRLPTDGTPPSFSSGVINSTVFNITSSGVLETSATAGNGAANGNGVRINDTGIKGYKVNDATPVFKLDATDGSITAINAYIQGEIHLNNPSTVRTDLNVANGADVTLTAVNGGLVVTGGGITLSAGGNIKGGQTSWGVGTGFFLGYEGGTYKSSIGTSTAYMKYDTSYGLQVRSGNTGVKGIDINPNGDNELHFYANAGGGVEEVASVGLSATYGGDVVIGKFGSVTAGNDKIGVYGASYSKSGVVGTSNNTYGVEGVSQISDGIRGVTQSSSQYGVVGVCPYASGSGVYGSNGGVGGTGSGRGVVGYAYQGVGVVGINNGYSKAPMRLEPSWTTSPPTHTAPLGSLWTRADGYVYSNYNGSTGWRLVG